MSAAMEASVLSVQGSKVAHLDQCGTPRWSSRGEPAAMLNIITTATAARPRLELLLIVQQQLRSHPGVVPDRHMSFEVSKAIEELSCGQPTSHTECVERWCAAYLQVVA